MLDSISLFLDDPPVLRSPALSTSLKLPWGKYQHVRLSRLEELASPLRLDLPEVFQRSLTAFSRADFDEVDEQNRLGDMIRYNFSHGVQVSVRDIFRHPLLEFVPAELLPSPHVTPLLFQRWPLLSSDMSALPELKKLEEILQNLLARISDLHRQKKLEVFVQTSVKPNAAMKVQSLEFDVSLEVDWRVEFKERKELESEFALVSFRKLPLHFYRSYAVEPTEGIVIIHPWLQELSLLQEKLSSLSEDALLPDQKMPSFELVGELEAKAMLKYLRARMIPVKVSGESRTLRADQSRMEIRLQESGDFYIQHEARVFKQKNLIRKGWTARTALYLQTLSLGLPYLLGTEAKEIASRQQGRREWDLKLLKHLGILHFVFLETVFFHFEGTLSNGLPTTSEELFTTLKPLMQKILIAGPGESFVKNYSLEDLCSRPVLACFDEFVKNILVSMKASEAFYSEQGEVILEGVIEREFRLLLHLFLGAVPSSDQGSLEFYKKSKKPLLAKTIQGELLRFPTATKERALPKALEQLQSLIPFGFVVFLNDRPLLDLEETDIKIDFVLRSESDERFFNWFELSPKFFLHGVEVEADSILKLGGGGVVEHDGKLYAVPKDMWPTLQRLENFWYRLQKGKSEASKKDRQDEVYKLPRHQALELLALRASGIPLRGDENWKRLCQFYDQLGVAHRPDSLQLSLLPASTAQLLKPYQRTGISWLLDLYQLRFGALLADDMGLGKTLQAVAFLEILRAKKELGQVLIVVPSSLIFNWQQEIAKYTPELPVRVFTRDKDNIIGKKLLAKEEMIVITTYGLLLEHEDYLNQFSWNVVLFDEAQNLKNISTKRTSAARSLNASFKMALTGTPMENHYGEFYSLMDLLVPGSLGYLEDFRRRFVNTEMVTREEMDELRLRMKPLILRRTKREILDQLPPKQETTVSIVFEEEQKEIYRDVALSYNNRVQETMAISGAASIQLQMLTALLRLRQVCSDPAALPNIQYNKVPPKLSTLKDCLQEIVESKESALVFTQFLQTLHHTEEILKQAGIPVFVLHGGIPAKQRQKIISDFIQYESGAVLLLTLKTGGVGLNLTKASYVFHLEPWWNPAVEDQASDRAHRLGQTKAVQVFKYIMHESLEEKIEDLQARKDRKFAALFSELETETDLTTAKSALTKQDFDWLLGIR